MILSFLQLSLILHFSAFMLIWCLYLRILFHVTKAAVVIQEPILCDSSYPDHTDL